MLVLDKLIVQLEETGKTYRMAGVSVGIMKINSKRVVTRVTTLF